MALTLHLSQTLPSVDLNVVATTIEIEKERQAICARCSGIEEWSSYEQSIYPDPETLSGMLGANITFPCSVSLQVYRASSDKVSPFGSYFMCSTRYFL